MTRKELRRMAHEFTVGCINIEIEIHELREKANPDDELAVPEKDIAGYISELSRLVRNLSD